MGLTTSTKAQSIYPLELNLGQPSWDSSFYDVQQIAPNDYWLCGESGVLKSIDTNFNIKTISIPYQTSDLLKIGIGKKFIFIASLYGIVHIYDTQTQGFVAYQLPKKYQKSVLYDLLILNDSTLLLAGGNPKIVKGKAAIPRGFILKTNPFLNKKPLVVWKNKLKFPFCLYKNDSLDQVFAACYSGLNTKIMTLANTRHKPHFRRYAKVKALIHSLQLYRGKMYFGGSKNFRYSKNGLVGSIDVKNKHIDPKIFETQSCVWQLHTSQNKLLALSKSGIFQSEGKDFITKQTVFGTNPYKMLAIRGGQYLVVGSQKKAFIISP